MAPGGAGFERQEEEEEEGKNNIDGDAISGGLVDYMEDLEEQNSSAEFRVKHLVSDVVENFYLQSGAVAVSIMQLPLCIDDDVVSEGAGLSDEVYLVGQSVSESREIRVSAEKWMLDLRPKSPPTFLVKTACGWIRAQKPKVVYRKIMSDGLIVGHFLHYVCQHPSASARATREHLSQEFRLFAEKPSLEKLSEFFPVIKRYMELDKRMANSNILQEFFPGRFSDVVASCTARDIKGTRTCHDPLSPRTTNGRSAMDLDEKTIKEVKDEQGERRTAQSLKATKAAHRATVQAELRNLHSKWCTLLGNAPPVKREKKPSTKKKGRPARRHSPAAATKADPISKKSEPISKKSEPISKKSDPIFKKSDPSSKKSERPKPNSKNGERKGESQKDTAAKKVRQPDHDADPQPKRRRTLEQYEARSVSTRAGLAYMSSLESKASILDGQQAKSKPFAKLLSKKKSQEKTMNLRRTKEAMKTAPAPPVRDWAQPVPAARGVGPMGVHSPSTEIFDRLEDPPICTICDDGGDLICCEGPCQRHFHATYGEDTNCETLGLTPEHVKKIDKFYCKNCLLDQHQCFLCQKLGSSAPSFHRPQEVYICDAPGCRKFYHARCVAKVLDPEVDWTAMAERIERGLHGFLCPRHTCATCKSMEIQPGAFVQCRRCPKAWHRDCLTNFAFSGELPTTSIWKHYDREFVYCKRHKILPSILTPLQDHVRFPNHG